MTAAFDNTFLTLMLDRSSFVRPDPNTGIPTKYAHEKLMSLIDRLSKDRETLIIPAPAIAEVMCRVRPAELVISELNRYSCIEPYPFDQKCAVTLSDMMCGQSGRLKEINERHRIGKQRIKVDLQIVAVAVTYGADVLYTDDDGQTAFAELFGLNVMHTWNLQISPERAQIHMDEVGVIK